MMVSGVNQRNNAHYINSNSNTSTLLTNTRVEVDVDSEQYKILLSVANAYKGSEYPFPVKLHYMLDDIEKKGQENIVSWLPDGRGFMVHKPKEVAKEILPNWFRQKCYGSFQRQLNLYNFKRVKSGSLKGAYYHDLFVKGVPVLSYGIKRVPIKNAAVVQPESNHHPHPEKTTPTCSSLTKPMVQTKTSSINHCFPHLTTNKAQTVESNLRVSSPPSSLDEERCAFPLQNEAGCWPKKASTFGTRSNSTVAPDCVNSKMTLLLKEKSVPASSLMFSSMNKGGEQPWLLKQSVDGTNKACLSQAATTLLPASRRQEALATAQLLNASTTRPSLATAAVSKLSFPKFPSSLSLCSWEDNSDLLGGGGLFPDSASTFLQQKQQMHSSGIANRSRVIASSSFQLLANLVKEWDKGDYLGSTDMDIIFNKSNKKEQLWCDDLVAPTTFSTNLMDNDGTGKSPHRKGYPVIERLLEPELRSQIIRTFLPQGNS